MGAHLPTGTATSPEAIRAVSSLIRLAVEHAAEVSAAYAARGFVFYGHTPF